MPPLGWHRYLDCLMGSQRAVAHKHAIPRHCLPLCLNHLLDAQSGVPVEQHGDFPQHIVLQLMRLVERREESKYPGNQGNTQNGE